jgi:AhpD family alkylhydroperoxidase
VFVRGTTRYAVANMSASLADVGPTGESSRSGYVYRVYLPQAAGVGLQELPGGGKQVMVPGVLDPLTKEMVYLAVSAANGCDYCIASHTAGARRAGMSEAMRGELLAVVGMACETNSLANAYQVPVDERFRDPDPD